MASSIAPPQRSETSGDSVQIVDALSAETSVHGREQTGLLGPKADSSKERVASSTVIVSPADYSQPLSARVCTLCACMYTKRVCKGQRGASRGVLGPTGDMLAERREE